MVLNKIETIKNGCCNPIWPKSNMAAKIAIEFNENCVQQPVACIRCHFICFQGQTFQINRQNA